MSTEIPKFDTKAQALRGLVLGAANEQRTPTLRDFQKAEDFVFDPAGWERQYHLDDLVQVLKTTDALFVLDELLNGEGRNEH